MNYIKKQRIGPTMDIFFIYECDVEQHDDSTWNKADDWDWKFINYFKFAYNGADKIKQQVVVDLDILIQYKYYVPV